MLAKCYLGLAIAFLSSCFSCTFHRNEVEWFWADMPNVPYYLAGLSLLFFVFYYRRKVALAGL